MTMTATMAKATLNHAISFSLCKSHLSSGVTVAVGDGSERDMTLEGETRQRCRPLRVEDGVFVSPDCPMIISAALKRLLTLSLSKMLVK